MKQVRRICLVEDCEKVLQSNNRIGFCRKHRNAGGAQSEYNAAYHAKNRARLLANHAIYNAENRERIAAYHAAYYSENRERFAINQTAYRSENRERIAAYYAAYYSKNRESIEEKKAAYNARNPENQSRYGRERRARRRNLLIETPKRSTVWARTGGQCHICLSPVEYESKWHVDHVLPLALGGVEHIENLAPTHAHCNQSKHIKIESLIPWVESAAWEISTNPNNVLIG